MDRERIFNLVRKEEVILWAGSGLSIYAGFPSGADLAKKIMAELSREERESINVGNDLASIAEDFVNIRSGSRNELNMILGNIFNRTPDSTKLHDIIAKIPHIKRIITTNYDKLFELAYKNECVVIINAKDTSNLSDRKVAIFKVHGCVSVPDSMILTKSDYVTLHNIEFRDIMWATLLAQLSNKSILFIGYSNNDLHFRSLFEIIRKQFGNIKREDFYVVPRVPTHEKKALERLGMTVIEETAEVFLSALYKNIEDNILQDQRDGRVSFETVNTFMANHSLNHTTDVKNGKPGITAITGLDGNINGKMKLEFSDSNTKAELIDFMSGNLKNFNLPVDKLKDIEIRINGIKVAINAGELNSLYFQKPRLPVLLDITILKSKIRLRNVSCQIFNTTSQIELLISLEGAEFQIRIDKGTEIALFNYVGPKFFSTVSGALDVSLLLYNIVNCNQIILHFKHHNIRLTFKLKTLPKREVVSANNDFINYLKKLITIEIHFGISFIISDIKYPNDVLDEILLSISGRKRKRKSEGFRISFSNYEDVKEDIKAIQSSKEPLTITSNTLTKVTLFGIEITLGFLRIKLLEPQILNETEIREGQTNVMELASKNNEGIYSYVTETRDPDLFRKLLDQQRL